jgi:hypothetical protein
MYLQTANKVVRHELHAIHLSPTEADDERHKKYDRSQKYDRRAKIRAKKYPSHAGVFFMKRRRSRRSDKT